MKLLTGFLLIISIVVSCTKDKVPNCETCSEDCKNFEFFDEPSLIPININNLSISKPCFNPNDNNEFVYQFRDNDTNVIKLVKYNIATKQKTLLAEGINGIISQPKWNKNGWIVYDSYPDYQIHIIKENGDSLTQISLNTSNLFPDWDENGENIYWQHTPTLGYPYYLLKYNIQTTQIDTVFNDFAGNNDISNNNILLSKFAIAQDIYLGVSPLNSINFNPIYNIGFTSLEGLTWHPNNAFFYFTDNNSGGLKKCDINSSAVTLLIQHCDSKKYTNLSCSADGSKLVAERVNSHLEYDNSGEFTGNIIHDHSIYLIDLQTLVETKIDL